MSHFCNHRPSHLFQMPVAAAFRPSPRRSAKTYQDCPKHMCLVARCSRPIAGLLLVTAHSIHTHKEEGTCDTPCMFAVSTAPGRALHQRAQSVWKSLPDGGVCTTPWQRTNQSVSGCCLCRVKAACGYRLRIFHLLVVLTLCYMFSGGCQMCCFLCCFACGV
jgi:hypothetical protein